MKKSWLLILLIVCSLYGCDVPQGNTIQKENKGYKLDEFLKKFVSDSGKMFQNDVHHQDALIGLKNQLITFIDTNGLNDYPMKIVSISPIDNGYGEGYIIHFENNSDRYGIDSISKNTHLDIFAVVDKNKTTDLKQSDTDFYVLSKCFKTEFFPSGDTKLITSDMLWAPLNISQSYGTYEYDINNFVTHATEIKHYQN